MPGAAFRNFDEDYNAKEIARGEGPVFELGGEEFHCLPVPPAGAVLDLVQAISRDDRGRTVYNVPDIDTFIRACLVEKRYAMQPAPADVEGKQDPEAQVEVVEDCDDVARWAALLHDKKRLIPSSVIGDLYLWLQEQYASDRPTQRSVR